MANLDDPEVRELLEQPNYGVVSTMNPDGSIHNTVVWVGTDEGKLTVNSAAGRRWPTNLERNALAQKYIGQDEYPYRQPGEQRIKFVVEPERIRYLKQG